MLQYMRAVFCLNDVYMAGKKRTRYNVFFSFHLSSCFKKFACNCAIINVIINNLHYINLSYSFCPK